MNICVFNIRENNPYIGGVERVTYSLCEEWVRSGHKVICCSVYNSHSPVEYQKVCPEFFLPNNNVVDTHENFNYIISVFKRYDIQLILNQAFPWADVDNFCYHIKSELHIKLFTAIHYAPDQPYIGAKNNLFVKRSDDGGIIWFIRQLFLSVSFYLYRGYLIRKRERRLVRMVSFQSDIVVSLSNVYAKVFSKMTTRDNFISIMNPIESRAIPVMMEKKNQVVYVGRLEYGLKRFDRVLKIWSKIEPNFPLWNLVVLGSGRYQKSFQSEADKLKLRRIEFLGFQNPNKFLMESKILLLTSSSEGLPMVILEAKQHACVPVLFNSFGAASELIQDGVDGYLIRPYKINDFIEELSSLMSNNEKLAEMSRYAFQSIGDNYSVEKIAMSWISLFNEWV